jgi:hypothetical protein
METRETLDFRRSCFEIYPLRIALYPVSAQGRSLPRVDLVNLWCRLVEHNQLCFNLQMHVTYVTATTKFRSVDSGKDA